MAAFFAEVYETRIGYSGPSLGYQLGTVFGSGFAPIIALALLRETGTVTSGRILHDRFGSFLDDMRLAAHQRGSRHISAYARAATGCRMKAAVLDHRSISKPQTGLAW